MFASPVPAHALLIGHKYRYVYFYQFKSVGQTIQFEILMAFIQDNTATNNELRSSR
jgi:hypothetical protein